LLLLFSGEGFSQYRTKTKRDTTRYNEKSMDVKTFRAFNNINSKFVNSMINITNESLTPVSIAVPLGIYISSQIEDNAYDQSSAVLLALSEVTNGLVTIGIKKIVKRDRPFRTLNNVYITDTNAVKGSYSFPSGHTSGSFVIATSLTLRYPDNPWIVAGSFTYATIVSLGRIYWGVHYPSDVLVGAFVGAGSAALIYSLRVPIIEAKNNLFNQSDRTDNVRSGNINAGAFLLTIAATDFLNYQFNSSKSKILKNSKIDLSSTIINNKISYTFNF
jgi:undecaprenyl-diphosphatase